PLGERRPDQRAAAGPWPPPFRRSSDLLPGRERHGYDRTVPGPQHRGHDPRPHPAYHQHRRGLDRSALVPGHAGYPNSPSERTGPMTATPEAGLMKTPRRSAEPGI